MGSEANRHKRDTCRYSLCLCLCSRFFEFSSTSDCTVNKQWTKIEEKKPQIKAAMFEMSLSLFSGCAVINSPYRTRLQRWKNISESISDYLWYQRIWAKPKWHLLSPAISDVLVCHCNLIYIEKDLKGGLKVFKGSFSLGTSGCRSVKYLLSVSAAPCARPSNAHSTLFWEQFWRVAEYLPNNQYHPANYRS